MNNPWSNRRPSVRPPRATPPVHSAGRGEGGDGPVRGNDELRLHGSRLRSVPRPQVYGMAGLGRSGVDGQGRAPGACTKDYYFHSTMRR